MTFLKKLGQILLTIATTAIGLGPMMAPLFGSKGTMVDSSRPTIANDLTAIGTVIVQIETAFTTLPEGTGAQKLAAAIALVGPIILTSQIVSGKKIANEALMQTAISEITQGVVDLLNSMDQSAAKTAITGTPI